jgi:hypothetical protein
MSVALITGSRVHRGALTSYVDLHRELRGSRPRHRTWRSQPSARDWREHPLQRALQPAATERGIPAGLHRYYPRDRVNGPHEPQRCALHPAWGAFFICSAAVILELTVDFVAVD